MTDEEKIIALAKLDEWTWIDGWQHPDVGCGYRNPPDYTTSYDAIIPLVQKMDKETQRNIAQQFWRESTIDIDDIRAFFNSSPSEIADALLKAKGLLC